MSAHSFHFASICVRLGVAPLLTAAVAVAQEQVAPAPSVHDDAQASKPADTQPAATAEVKLPEQPMQTAEAAAQQPKWLVAPYLWMIGVNGNVTVRNTKADVDVSFGDLLENLDFALMGRVEYGIDKWGLFFDGVYGSLSDDAKVGQQGIELSSDLTVLELGAFGQFFDRTLDASTNQHFKADALVGARYYDVDTELDFDTAGLPTLDDNEWWVDSFVGARLQWDFARNFSLTARGDVGGFGFGTASDLAWQAQSYLCWRMSKSATLCAGYRALDINRDQNLDCDLRISGPVLGAAFQF